MRPSFLLVDSPENSFGRLGGVRSQFDLVLAADGKGGLDALAEPKSWVGILAASRLADMTGLDFLARAASVSPAIPMLLAAEAELARTLMQANSQGVFRVVPRSTPAEQLLAVLRDAVRQMALLRQEHRLREHLAQLTVTDPLTGCRNRRHLEEYLPRELSRSLRYGHALSIILCDVDGLKAVNEAFGNRGGDAVLAGFARTVTECIRRDIDTLARWGEDAFVLVLPETAIRGAGRVASRIRDRFAACDLTQDGHRIDCTVSFGVAASSPEHGDRHVTAEHLLLIADRCLHQAKAAGGNQVLCCP